MCIGLFIFIGSGQVEGLLPTGPIRLGFRIKKIYKQADQLIWSLLMFNHHIKINTRVFISLNSDILLILTHLTEIILTHLK